jgi:DNA-binding LacI/PurR family transcriptional regulator/biotin operon repressor
MPRVRKQSSSTGAVPPAGLGRLDRPPSLTARVEQLLRQAIADGRFADGRLPTGVELADQLGVSRETVRLAAEVLQGEGLLVKIRRRGTFLQAPRVPDRLPAKQATALGYFQAGYEATEGQEEAVTRVMSGLMLQGALDEAGRQGFRLVVQHAPHTQIGHVFGEMSRAGGLCGAIFASYAEEKLLRRVAGLGLPILLLDHDLHLSRVHSVRDDSFQGARDAVLYLAGLGHRRIGYVNWRQEDLNPWRLQGYRQGLREARLARRRPWEFAVELTRDGARQAVEWWLGLASRPTAVYSFNNTLARLILEELAGRGVPVPAGVSVMGGGGEEVPGLACHQADWYQLGRTAVQILLRALAAPPGREPEHHLGPHTIRVGQTAAPPG